MNYVFFGTPRFAATILRDLIDNDMAPRAVVTNPDRPFGRKKSITPPPAKQVVIESRKPIDILQPENLNEMSEVLKAYKPDFFVVAAYAKILRPAIFNIPKLGTVGVHPSLLPKLRGASPIQSAIINGDTETGVTLFLIDELVDHGPILAQRKITFSRPTYGALEEELALLATRLLIETLPKLLKNEIQPKQQDEALATYTKKFSSEDGYISFDRLESAELGSEESASLERKIRALNPEPGVYTVTTGGKRVKLLEADLEAGKLLVRKIQREGEKPRAVDSRNWSA